MSELIRFISAEEFEEGIQRRILMGQVAVGFACKIRIEAVETRDPNYPVRYVEAAITIKTKSESDDGATEVEYVVEETGSSDDHLVDKESFNRDSIAISIQRGLLMRTYLSDDLDPRWDDSLIELADIESGSIVR